MRIYAPALVSVFLTMLSGGAAAQGNAPVADLADGRVGRIYFESVTPSGYFHLARGQATQKAVIVGNLQLPAGTADRVPAVVVSHGSGGVTDEREGRWAGILRDLGLATFVVDSFSPRNIQETATNQAQLSTAANVADALSALRVLATHPRIDPQRIAVMGFSKGGQVAMYTALEPFRRAIVPGETKFAAHVAFYPYCSDWYLSERVTGAPMLFLLGGLDDYTPAVPCRGYAEWFKSKGASTNVVVYPNAYHGFDSSQARAFFRDMTSGRNCDMAVDLDNFTIKSRNTGQDIRDGVAYGRNCLSRGVNLGNDGEARRRSPEDMAAFLKIALKL